MCREKCHKKQLLKFASNNKLVLLGRRKTSHCGGALKAEISSKISNFGDLRFFFLNLKKVQYLRTRLYKHSKGFLSERQLKNGVFFENCSFSCFLHFLFLKCFWFVVCILTVVQLCTPWPVFTLCTHWFDTF